MNQYIMCRRYNYDPKLSIRKLLVMDLSTKTVVKELSLNTWSVNISTKLINKKLGDGSLGKSGSNRASGTVLKVQCYLLRKDMITKLIVLSETNNFRRLSRVLRMPLLSITHIVSPTSPLNILSWYFSTRFPTSTS